ncbi:MAG: hypothetical protein GKS03_05705 [Alphaproteobacteria bacterium]|nr:hypothetical protein [Alphaproteobacteria bacterium]
MWGRVNTSLIGFIAVAAIALSPSARADGEVCARAADVEAFVIRDLQSQLMVAGLACGQRAPYNAFATLYETELVSSGNRLVDYFNSRSTGKPALDAHVTRAANAASLRHSENREAYCAQTAQFFRDLLGATERSLIQVAETAKLRSVTKPVLCKAKAPTVADALVHPVQKLATD